VWKRFPTEEIHLSLSLSHSLTLKQSHKITKQLKNNNFIIWILRSFCNAFSISEIKFSITSCQISSELKFLTQILSVCIGPPNRSIHSFIISASIKSLVNQCLILSHSIEAKWYALNHFLRNSQLGRIEDVVQINKSIDVHNFLEYFRLWNENGRDYSFNNF
jgi:hypothetical protein